MIRRPIASRRIARLAVFLVLISLLAGGFGQFSSPPSVRGGDSLSAALAQQRALAAKIAAQKAEIAKLNALQADLSIEISQTKTTLVGINTDLVVAQQRVVQMNVKVNAVRRAFNALVAHLADLDQELVRLVVEQDVKAMELTERKGILANRLRAAYSAGETSLLETILSADSFADALADVGYYLDIGDQDRALADKIKEDQAVLATISQTVTTMRVETEAERKETAAQKARLDARLADLKEAKRQLAKLQAETQRQLAIQAAAYRKLATNKAAARAALVAAAQANAEVTRKIDRLIAAQYKLGNIPSVYNGTLIWPMHGTLTQEFGCTGFSWEPPLGSCAHFHNGIDLAAPIYTPIRAAGHGRVVYAGPLSDGAWVVIIAHSQQLVTLYGHLDNRYHPPTVRAGQFVTQGQVIGYEGMTGNTTGPHLHWSVKMNDTWVNPRLFV
ncbi:MAG TPA: peptidoglycan DD-metalloendopeptidase family protein [Candidatus Limnocylindria bacterium]|nr:peptidoglycan DD-metalloendopeptidase family protein [Candidatus Limnocylindria bacterium]